MKFQLCRFITTVVQSCLRSNIVECFHKCVSNVIQILELVKRHRTPPGDFFSRQHNVRFGHY